MTFGVSGGFSNILKNTLSLTAGLNQTVYTCPAGAVAYVNIFAYIPLAGSGAFYLNIYDKANATFGNQVAFASIGSSFIPTSTNVVIDSSQVLNLYTYGKLADMISISGTNNANGFLMLSEGDRITVSISGSGTTKLSVDIREQTAA